MPPSRCAGPAAACGKRWKRWNGCYVTKQVGGAAEGALLRLKTDRSLRGKFPYQLRPVSVDSDLSKSYWNKGIMSEALKAVIDFGSATFGAHRVQAEVVPKNKASLKMLEKLGFKQEGVLHQYLMHEATKMFFDVVMLALLNN